MRITADRHEMDGHASCRGIQMIDSLVPQCWYIGSPVFGFLIDSLAEYRITFACHQMTAGIGSLIVSLEKAIFLF